MAWQVLNGPKRLLQAAPDLARPHARLSSASPIRVDRRHILVFQGKFHMESQALKTRYCDNSVEVYKI